MADSESNPLDGLREIIRVFSDRLDTREQVVRLEERVGRAATREEMNAADTRVLESVSAMFERSASSMQGYVRDQIGSSAQATKIVFIEALGSLEKHIDDKVDAAANKAASAAVAAAIASMPQDKRGGWAHPVPVSVTAGTLVSALWIFAQIMGLHIPTGG